MSCYQLRDADLWSGESIGVNQPLIRAAANPDVRVLERILSHGLSEWTTIMGQEPDKLHRELLDPNFYACGDEHGIWLTSPLLVAVENGHMEHVTLLVKAGADPNGVDVDLIRRHAAQWLRRHDYDCPYIGELCEDVELEVLTSWFASDAKEGYVTRSERLSGDVQNYRVRSQARPRSLSPFWSASFDRDRWDQGRVSSPPMTSLMRAAQLGNLEMFDELVDLGADASYWLDSSSWEGPTTHSAASRSTPLHLAVQNNHPEMVKHLLDRGHDPNCLPRSSATTSVTPLMASIMCYSFSPQSYQILASHSRSDWGFRTPYCNVHSGHFAAATGYVDLMADVLRKTSFNLADITSLGHTALHIALFPSDTIDLDPLSTIKDSLHDTRSLGLPYEEKRSDPSGHVQRMQNMVDWLIDRNEETLVMPDVYGNTPLHYKACLGGSLQGSSPSLRSSAVKKVWDQHKNVFGHTPLDLALDYRT